MNNISSNPAFPFSSDKGSASTSSDGNEPSSRNGFDRANPNNVAKTLTHVTISTGHVNDSPRHEVANDVIDELICWIKGAKPTVIPGIEGEWPTAQVPNCQNYLAMP